MDVVRYPDTFVTEVHGPGSSCEPRLDRWTISETARSVRIKTLDDASQEFPRINDRYAGRPHRYGYTSATDVGRSGIGHHGLRKNDIVGLAPSVTMSVVARWRRTGVRRRIRGRRG